MRYTKTAAALLLGFALSACSATQSETAMTATTDDSPITLAQAERCDMTLNFADEAEVTQWRTVLDGVMGGRSSGVRYAENGHMVFRGEIVTDGGGFSSIRRTMRPGDMSGAERLRLKFRSDGRAYKLTFRTSAGRWGRLISYQRPIPATPPGEWTEVEIALTDFDTSIFGRTVSAPAFDATDVREMGIILADGVDGDFRLEVGTIACTRAMGA